MRPEPARPPRVVLVADCCAAATGAARAELAAALDAHALTANDVAGALRLLGAVRPAAAVVCWSLAGGGGRAILERLAGADPADRVPVLGLGAPDEAAAALRAGCAAFLAKPLATGALAAALAALLGAAGA